MRARSVLLAVAAGLALADSSVVTLALPDIISRFDVEITTVAWALTSYNLVLALAAVPAAFLARRDPRKAFLVGALVFGAASLACGLAWHFAVLVAARCVQAAGGAFLVAAALDLLTQTEGSDERGARVWAGAGVLGAALGPAAGGILTSTVGWEWIFLLQAPLALLPLVAVHRLATPPIPAPAGRPHAGANLALLLLSGGLVAALFLLVLLLVEGWRMSPASAGLVVTIMPLAAIVAGRAVPPGTRIASRASLGVVLIAGGLSTLAVLPRAAWGWTIAPQILIGIGIGLALGVLVERALAGRAVQVVHGGWTLAARHAGVVLGLLILSPIFAAALARNENEAIRAGTAAVLDSHIPPLDKLSLAQDVLTEIHDSKGELPDVAIAFQDRPDSEEYRSLLRDLEDQLDRAVTHAFSNPFLLAAGLALAALGPLFLVRREHGV